MSSLKELQDLIHEKYGIEPSKLDPHASMRETGGLDSLALAEFLFAIEDHFGITMPDEDGVERPLKDHGPKLAAIREARASLDAFWNLTGMKKPAKVEHSGGVKYEIVGVDPADLA